MSEVRSDHMIDHPALDQLLRRADDALVETIAVRTGEIPTEATGFGHVRPFELPDLSAASPDAAHAGSGQPPDATVVVQIEVGRTRRAGDDASRLAAGSVVPLNRLVGDPVDIRADGRLVARGEILVWNEKFCVRVVEVLPKPNRREPVGVG